MSPLAYEKFHTTLVMWVHLRHGDDFLQPGITSTLSWKPQRYSYKGVDRCVLDPRCLWWSQSTVLANRSLISHYVLGAYWNWLVTLWPMSVAPNMVGHRNVVWGFQEELIFYVDRSQWLAWSLSFSAFSQCFIMIPCILWKNNLKGRQVLHIWCMSNPLWKSFPWAQPVFHPDGPYAYFCIRAWMLSMGMHSSNLNYLFQISYGYELRKQARRMGMAGPLGEIFDHGGVHSVLDLLSCLFKPDPIGCDALNTTVSGDKVYLSLILINQPKTARSTFSIECSRTRTFLLDYCLPNSYLGQLLSHIMGRVLYRYVTRKSQIIYFSYCSCNRVRPAVPRILLRASWRDYHDCHYLHHHWLLWFETHSFLRDPLPTDLIFYLFSFTGPSFWDQDLWKITHLDHIPFLPNLRLNESFMVIAGVLLTFNIIHRIFYFFQALHIALNTKKNLLIPKQLS